MLFAVRAKPQGGDGHVQGIYLMTEAGASPPGAQRNFPVLCTGYIASFSCGIYKDSVLRYFSLKRGSRFSFQVAAFFHHKQNNIPRHEWRGMLFW